MEHRRPERQIFLIGFMASGKSTVGRELAQRLDRDFVDLDSVIETTASMPIPDIFAVRGEEGFRELEAEALGRVIAGPPAVVATGGGAPCFGDGLGRMRAAGLVVSLDTQLEVALERARGGVTRPLLSASEDEVEALYRSRQPVYRQAHVTVTTDDRSIDEIASRIENIVAAMSSIPHASMGNTAVVAAGDVPYSIVVEPGLLENVGGYARACLPPRCTSVAVVSDSNVGPLYMEQVSSSLRASGFTVHEEIVTAGEGSKALDVFGRVVDALVAAGLDRGSAVFALGGGVVGDLAGFVAASLYRGVRVVQIPTTLLAMTDSSIGGKTGINIEAGKNLVGAFWQPSCVLADPSTLKTLPQRERRAAFGELIKYGLLDSAALFADIDALAPALGGDASLDDLPTELIDVVRRCAAYKAWVVTRDERESGERAWLNLGHTVGHAIEAAAGYGTLLHGEAVGLGLVAACRVSCALGMCDAAIEQQVVRTLQRAGLDSDLTPWLRDDVIARIGVDKKRTGSQVRFVTLRGVGAPALTNLELSQLSKILLA